MMGKWPKHVVDDIWMRSVLGVMFALTINADVNKRNGITISIFRILYDNIKMYRLTYFILTYLLTYSMEQSPS